MERAEDQHRFGLEALARDSSHSDRLFTRVLHFELKALAWWPLEHSGQVPHPDESLVFEGDLTPGADTIPCIICHKPIRKRLVHRGGEEGMYCEACKRRNR